MGSPPGTLHLAAVSGGADSTAMLAALAAIRDRAGGMGLYCIHVEHGIRPAAESKGDAQFVKALCGGIGVPCRIVHIRQGRIAELALEKGIGIEAAARHYRRRIWLREAHRLEKLHGGNVRILVAHQEDDMLETLLMRILRGSGPSGLAAMPPSRGRILRPLLALRRSDTVAYLREKNIAWREDATNADMRFFRNSVRNRLVPLLETEFPQWRTALASLARTQSLAAAFVGSEAESRIQWQPLPAANADSCSLITSAAHFFSQPSIIREEAVFQGIDHLLKIACAGPSRSIKRINIRRFCEKQIADADLGLLRLRCNASHVIILLKPYPDPRSPNSELSARPSESGFSLLIKVPGFYTLKGVDIEVCESLVDEGKNEDAFFALLPLVIRPCLKEDRAGKRNGMLPSGGELTAADMRGAAAFIGSGRVVWRRNKTPLPGECWIVKIN